MVKIENTKIVITKPGWANLSGFSHETNHKRLGQATLDEFEFMTGLSGNLYDIATCDKTHEFHVTIYMVRP